MNLAPYLSFSGNCQEALELYCNALGGSIVEKHCYAENPEMAKHLPADWHNKLMHASFKAGSICLMAADVIEGKDGPCGIVKLSHAGSPIALSLNFNNETEQTAAFNKLAQGGIVTMPLQDTFWGARFGMLSDKFGIKWMFNCDKVSS